jgi:Domain of unknown function (DUF4337)
MEIAEHARESVEHAHQHGPPAGFARRVALLIAALAAALALTEIAAQSAQTAYVAHNIRASDNWTFYGFKETRARIAEQTATILQTAVPGPPDQARQDAVTQAQATVKRMREGDASGPGTRQIQEQAKEEEDAMEHALHHYHLYEYASGALQLAIVLASAAVVTQLAAVAVAAGILGALACLGALAVGAGLV